MSKVVVCPKGHNATVEDAQIGTSVACPTCGETFVAQVSAAAAGAAPHHHVPMPHISPQALAGVACCMASFKKYCLPAARAALVLGLFIVVVARGCDVVGGKSATAATARLNLDRAKFAREWEQTRTDLTKQRDDLKKEADPILNVAEGQRTADQRKKVEQYNAAKDALDALPAKQQKAQEDLQKEGGGWFALENAAANNTVAAPGRERWSVLGALLVIFGLLGVATSAAGSERLAALVLLAVVIMSYFGIILAIGQR